jgi:hypothetical protein
MFLIVTEWIGAKLITLVQNWVQRRKIVNTVMTHGDDTCRLHNSQGIY